MPLAAVDRLEEVDRGAIAFSGGRMRLTDLDGASGTIIPVLARAALPEAGRVTLIRLRQGDAEVAYAVAETVEIAALGGEWAEAPAGGGLLGVALHDGAPVEIVNAWRIVRSGCRVPAETRPVCRAGGRGASNGWPASSRRCWNAPVTAWRSRRRRRGTPMTFLAMDDEEISIPTGGTLVRLSERPDAAGIFRYDRDAVLAAVAGAGR